MKFNRYPLFILTSIALLAQPTLAKAETSRAIGLPPNVTINAKHVMVSFGDSISAAALGGTSADSPASFLPSIVNIANLPLLFSANIKQTLIENKQLYSWASGIAVSSHYVRLQKYLNSQGEGRLQMVNMAVSGAVAYDLLAQVRKFAAAMKKAPDAKIDYVTILIGANDVCATIPQNEIISSLKQVFAEIAQIPQASKTKILVSSIPQIFSLGQPKIKNHLTGTLLMSCERIRSQILKSCNNLTHWDDEAGYRADVKVVEDMNSLLLNLSVQAMQDNPNLDIHYTDAFYRETPAFSQLASDCFHPNMRGQSHISEILWAEQPWFK